MSSLLNPATNFTLVTPSDTTVLQEFRGLYVGVTGDVVIKNRDGVAVTFTAVPAGSILPIQGTQVMAATGATGVIAFY